MKVIREERTVFKHQLKNGEMQVLLPGDNHILHLSFYEAPSEEKSKEAIEALEKAVLNSAPAGKEVEAHILIVRVKGTKAMAAGASTDGKFGDFVYATPLFGMITEPEITERMKNSLHNAVVTHNRTKLIIRKAMKTGFMTAKARALFSVAVASHTLVNKLEMQTARDLVSALHNMDFPTTSE